MRKSVSRHGRPILGLAAACALALMSNSAAAQGTPEQRAACEGDAQRLCSQFIPDVDRIKTCLGQYRRYLSAACRSMFEVRPGNKRSRS
jgi:type II secretory pathway component PulL